MKRKQYLRLRERYVRRGKELVYLDESGFDSSVTRQYARALIGKKVYGLRGSNMRPRTSLLIARFKDKLKAPLLFKGTCNTEFFNAWVEKALCPFLNKNHVVVMDNASIHKSAKTRELIEGTGATLLFLSPYSPDLNPIENDFANIKRLREFNENETIEEIIRMYI